MVNPLRPCKFEKLITSQEEAIRLRNILITILKMDLISHSLSRCVRIVYSALTGFCLYSLELQRRLDYPINQELFRFAT